MKDYSQYGEQQTILREVQKLEKQPKDLRFLDIGAWHPTQFSNTRALYELGWSGLMIEPSPGPMINLLTEYGRDPRVTLLQAAIMANAPGTVTMWVTDDAVSTSSIAEHEKWKDAATFRGELVVPAIDVQMLFGMYGGFDFVSIDAEGNSVDIFLAMLSQGILPPVVCVEHESRVEELLVKAQDKRYDLARMNSTNAVLTRGI